MTDVTQDDQELTSWLAAVRSRFSDAGYEYLEVSEVLAPEGTLVVVVHDAEAANASLDKFTALELPRLAVLANADSARQCSVLLIGRATFEVILRLPNDETNEDRPLPGWSRLPDISHEEQTQLEALVAAAAERLVVTSERWEPVDPDAVRARLIDECKEMAPDNEALARGIYEPWMISRRVTEPLANRVRQQHRGDWRRRADEIAEAILAGPEDLTEVNRPVVADVAYEFLQAEDDCCATRKASEPVVSAILKRRRQGKRASGSALF